MEKRIESVWQGWKVVQKIGVGGFGSVYEIERDVFGKTESAALKVISIPQNNDEIKSLRYEGYDEASISAHYKNHLEDIVKEYSFMLDMKGFTNIVYCDDLRYTNHDDGIGWDIFIKMELLTPLLHIVSTDFGEAEIIKLGKDICNALAYCKKFNLVHRDIKPQNIFVSRVGDFKLGDFGIAKVSERTQSGTKIGTLEYMSPEVYAGKPYGVGSDIYSLGLVLYWLLNEKRHPFITTVGHIPTATEKSEANLRRLNGEEIPAPVNGSDELKRIVLKACACNPENRYASAEEMLEDLSKLSLEFGAFAVKSADAENNSDDDKTISLFGVPTQPEFPKKSEKTEPIVEANEDSDKTEVLRKPEPQPKVEPTNENNVNGKSFTEDEKAPENKEKKNKKGVLFAAIAVIAVFVVILILLLRSCDEDAPIEDASSTAVSEYVSESESSKAESNESESNESENSETESSEAENSETESSTDTSDIPDESVEVHTHAYSERYESNETAHWYECECGEVSGMELHDYGDWIILTNATETNEGEKERTCKDCAYEESAVIPVLGHTHSYSSDWKKNESSHWKECTCGEKNQLTTHNYGSWTTVTAATCTSNGSQKHTCQTCGYAETRTVYATGHSISAWTSEVEVTCTSDGIDERYCYNCSYSESKTVSATGHYYSNGICYYCGESTTKGLAYQLKNGTYHITGIGSCTDNVIYIPKKINGIYVTTIAYRAFVDCTQLTNVIIPDSITNIEIAAFQNCTGLTSITIPDSVTTIDSWAFAYTEITSVYIPHSVTEIDSYAFAYCPNLSYITVDSNNPIYHSKGNCIIETETKILIQGCNNSTIPNDGSVEEIGSAFEGCDKLTSITIPNSVKVIGSFAFYNCKGLKSITIPNSVTEISACAFDDCNNLSSVTFKDTSGWYVEDYDSAELVSNLNVNNASTNAIYLRDTYRTYNIKKRT